MKINIQEISGRPLLPSNEMYGDIPIGIRYILLIILLRRNELKLKDWLPYYSEANRTYNKMIIRQQEAEKAEIFGEIDKAIELYEMNIRDCYHNKEPYSRLYKYYCANQQYLKAKWVCLSFIEMASIIQQIDHSCHRNDELLLEIEEFCEKMKKMEFSDE